METTWTLSECRSAVSKVGIEMAILRQGSIPVALGVNNVKPELIAGTGETTRTRSYVLVNALEAFIQVDGVATSHVATVAITAYGEADARSHGRKTLPVVRYHRCHAATPEAFAEVLECLSSEIDRAVLLCSQIDALYADAEARTAIISERRADCATREGYEAACVAAGIQALADSEILDSYGVAYGDFSYPEYEPEHVVRMGLAAARLKSLKADHEHAAREHALPTSSSIAPTQQGQIWEPCERCGSEPSYLPLHLCSKCWPKH